jgi:hypothetical protein
MFTNLRQALNFNIAIEGRGTPEVANQSKVRNEVRMKIKLKFKM